MRGWLGTTFVLLLVAPTTWAEPTAWQSVAESSTLEFAAYYEGERLPGAFTRFSVRLQTDPVTGHPFELVVKTITGSADMNDDEANAELAEADWFDAASHPESVFRSEAIRAAGAEWRAAGRLHIKGIEQPLDVPFTLAIAAGSDRAVLAGSLQLSRGAWQVGAGEWANSASLSDRVDVTYRVVLAPAP